MAIPSTQGASPYSFRVDHISPPTPGTHPSAYQAQNMASPSPSTQGASPCSFPTHQISPLTSGTNPNASQAQKMVQPLAWRPVRKPFDNSMEEITGCKNRVIFRGGRWTFALPAASYTKSLEGFVEAGCWPQSKV